MVRHIISWNFKDSVLPEHRAEKGGQVKQELEGLRERIPGIVSLEVHINELDSSNRDLLLDSVFESAEALRAYQIHPEHVRVSEFVGTIVEGRACFDFLV